jgi:hypothetical protein
MLLLRGPLQNANRATMVVDIGQIHHWGVLHSQGRQISVVVDMQEQTLKADREFGPALNLPKYFRIDKVIMEGAIFDSGKIVINYRNGKCNAFALLLSPPSGRGKWLFACGASSQVKIYDEADFSEAEIAAWLARWSHAD